MKDVFFWGPIVLIMGIFLYVGSCIRQGHEEQIRTWAAERNYTVEKIERVGFYNDSPYWRQKHDDLCRAVLSDHDHQKKISFFRFGGWLGMEQAWAK